MTKKSVLFITTQVPFPPLGGGTNKSLHLLKFLTQHYDVHFASLSKSNALEDLEGLEKEVDLSSHRVVSFERPRTAKVFLQSVLNAPTLNVYRNQSPALAEYIKEKASSVDILFVDHLEMMAMVPVDFDGKIVLHEHNAEYLLWQRMAKISGFFKSIALYYEAQRVYRYEMRSCRNADVVFAAPNDQLALQQQGTIPNLYTTYHLGIESTLELPDLQFEETKKRLYYLGTLSWEANISGLIWFFENLWEGIKKEEPEVEFHLLGGNIDARLEGFVNRDKRIIYHGFVDDPEMIRKTCRVAVVPQLFGSGLKVKVVDAAYRGMPVVTTTIGAEGWGFEPDSEMAVCDEPKDFSAAVVKLLRDKEYWQQLSTNSRTKASSKFRWKQEFERLEKGMATL